MNPGIDNTPGLGFPQPSSGMGQASVPGVPNFPQQPASMPMPVTGGQPPYQPQAPIPQAAAPQQSAPLHPSTHFAGEPNAEYTAEGVDDTALDEEWVNKAKEVVLRTQTDPYLQSKEITRIKAQYVKLRYNKDMKVIEE
jgi:hypothetical protein